MALSDEDCLDLITHLFRSARDVDPSLHDRLEEYFEPEGEPLQNLKRCMGALIQIVRSESSGGYHRVLHRLQSFIRDENGNAVSEVEIRLTRHEEYLYGTEVLRLSELPDMDECLRYLMSALEGIGRQQ